MYEEGVIRWESVLTILIGIVILAFIVLIIYKKRASKRKRIMQEAALQRKTKNMQNKPRPASQKPILIKKKKIKH